MGSSLTPARTAIVLGGGVSGLLAARELAAAGHAVTVLEATATWGGCVGSHVVAGLTLDSGAESFATRSTAVADLAAELGLAGKIVAPRPGGAWVQLPDGPRELPKTGVLGIPANPWDPEVRRSLGLVGSLRASLDKYLPARVGAGAEVTSVSALVRARMGRRVLERLVAPVVGGVHSADPGLLDVDMVAPGLRAGIKEHGSLAAAVAAQRRSTGAPSAAKAGSAVAGLENGMHTLVAALLKDLQGRGAILLSGSTATAVERTAEGWRVTAGGSAYDGARLVVALPGPAAVGLLQEAVPALAGRSPEHGPDVRLVTLVVDLPELDGRPRGTGVLVAPQTPGIEAKALTHATAKWDWLAAAAGPGTHVLRLSYGRLEGVPGDGSPAADSTPVRETDLLAAALRDASTLLEMPVQGKDVVGWDVVRWQGALPFAALGHKARVAEIRGICSAEEGLSVVGGWVAGNGLAAVVFDTRKEIRALVG